MINWSKTKPTEEKSTTSNFDSMMNPSDTKAAPKKSTDIQCNLGKVKDKISKSDFLKEYIYIINIDFSKLNDPTKIEINELLENILKTTDETITLNYLTQLQWITNKYKFEKKNITDDAKKAQAKQKDETKDSWNISTGGLPETWGKAVPIVDKWKEKSVYVKTWELLKENLYTIQNIDDKLNESFWETRKSIKEKWEINTNEELEILISLFGTFWEIVVFAMLDVLYNTILVELGWKILFKDIWFILLHGVELYGESFSQLIKRVVKKPDFWSIFLLGLFIYVQVNYWVGTWKRFRSWVTQQRWEKDSQKEKVKKKTRVTGEDWKIEIREEMVESKLKTLFGKYYIDATSATPIIFDTTENLSNEADEYKKRMKAQDSLEQYFYDNPKVLNELKVIKLSSIQSNVPHVYWRKIWRLLNSHSLLRKVIWRWLIPEFAKKEHEDTVLDFIKEKQKAYIEAIWLLYGVNDKWEISKNNESNFLKWLRSYIENDKSLTKREKESISTRLNTFLTKIWTNRLIDKKRLLEELYRTKEWLATKSEMINNVEEELNKTREWWDLKRIWGATKDFILRKRSNLEKFRDKIANWDWNWTYEEFIKELNRVKESSIWIIIKEKKIKFWELDNFTKGMENNHIEVEERKKLYEGKSISHLENYIRYILPNESEEKVKKILESFKDRKTAYLEIDFYRELQRIKDAYIPSYILLEELEKAKDKIKEEIKKEEKIKEGKINEIVWKLKKLIPEIEKIEVSSIPAPEKVNIVVSIEASIYNIRNWDYKLAIDTLNSMISRIPAEFWHQIKTLLNEIKSIKLKRRVGDIQILDTQTITNKDKVEKIEHYTELAKKGVLNLNKEQLIELKKWELNSELNYTSEYTEENKNETKAELEKYQKLSNYDFREQLWKPKNLHEIEKALEEIFKTELGYINILDQISWENHDIRKELKLFAKSLNENDYTRWQAREILEKIFAWEANVNFEEVIKNTINHEAEFEKKKELKDRLNMSFEELEPSKKKEILEFIGNIWLNNDELPEKIKQELKAFRDALVIWEKIITQKAEIVSMSSHFDSEITSIEDLKNLKKRFDEYITKQNINRNSEDFKSLIEEYNIKYNEKFSELEIEEINKEELIEIEEKNKLKIEKLKTIIEEINKEIKGLNDYSIPENESDYEEARNELKRKGVTLPESKKLIANNIWKVDYSTLVQQAIDAKIEKLNEKKLVESRKLFDWISSIPVEIIEADTWLKKTIEILMERRLQTKGGESKLIEEIKDFSLKDRLQIDELLKEWTKTIEEVKEEVKKVRERTWKAK